MVVEVEGEIIITALTASAATKLHRDIPVSLRVKPDRVPRKRSFQRAFKKLTKLQKNKTTAGLLSSCVSCSRDASAWPKMWGATAVADRRRKDSPSKTKETWRGKKSLYDHASPKRQLPVTVTVVLVVFLLASIGLLFLRFPSHTLPLWQSKSNSRLKPRNV
eukprot:7138638-Pyramimonas_sp.AAC.1